MVSPTLIHTLQKRDFLLKCLEERKGGGRRERGKRGRGKGKGRKGKERREKKKGTDKKLLVNYGITDKTLLLCPLVSDVHKIE